MLSYPGFRPGQKIPHALLSTFIKRPNNLRTIFPVGNRDMTAYTCKLGDWLKMINCVTTYFPMTYDETLREYPDIQEQPLD